MQTQCRRSPTIQRLKNNPPAQYCFTWPISHAFIFFWFEQNLSFISYISLFLSCYFFMNIYWICAKERKKKKIWKEIKHRISSRNYRLLKVVTQVLFWVKNRKRKLWQETFLWESRKNDKDLIWILVMITTLHLYLLLMFICSKDGLDGREVSSVLWALKALASHLLRPSVDKPYRAMRLLRPR